MLRTRSILSYYRQIIWRNLCTSENPIRAGHSKWANIKHTKALKDGQKATVFTKLSRQIRLAVQDGGADAALNPQLRSVMEEAVRKNMPMTTILNNIQKSRQEKKSKVEKQYRLEVRIKNVYAICILYTDNFSRKKMEILSIIKKYGGTCVDINHMFENFGLIETSLNPKMIEEGIEFSERVTYDAIESGAEDVNITNTASGSINFICSAINLNAVRQSLEKRGYTIENAEHIFRAKNLVRLRDEELKCYYNILSRLHDIAGLDNIYDNVENDE